MSEVWVGTRGYVDAEPRWWVFLLDRYRGRLNILGGGSAAGYLDAALGSLIQIVELHQPRAGIGYQRRMSVGEYATQHWWCRTCCDSRCFEAPGDSHVRLVPDCCDTMRVAVENLYPVRQDLPPVLAGALRTPAVRPQLVDPGRASLVAAGRVRYFDRAVGGRELNPDSDGRLPFLGPGLLYASVAEEKK